jgi:hypothetical protein
LFTLTSAKKRLYLFTNSPDINGFSKFIILKNEKSKKKN